LLQISNLVQGTRPLKSYFPTLFVRQIIRAPVDVFSISWTYFWKLFAVPCDLEHQSLTFFARESIFGGRNQTCSSFDGARHIQGRFQYVSLRYSGIRTSGKFRSLVVAAIICSETTCIDKVSYSFLYFFVILKFEYSNFVNKNFALDIVSFLIGFYSWLRAHENCTEGNVYAPGSVDRDENDSPFGDVFALFSYYFL
jgi:hypothetical protein